MFCLLYFGYGEIGINSMQLSSQFLQFCSFGWCLTEGWGRVRNKICLMSFCGFGRPFFILP